MPITCLFRETLGARGLFLFDALCACCIGPWPTQGKVTTTIHWRSDGLGLAAALRERQRDRRPDSMDGATMLDCAACLIRVTGSWERGRRSAAYRTQAWAHDEGFCAARCPLNGWLAGWRAALAWPADASSRSAFFSLLPPLRSLQRTAQTVASS